MAYLKTNTLYKYGLNEKTIDVIFKIPYTNVKLTNELVGNDPVCGEIKYLYDNNMNILYTENDYVNIIKSNLYIVASYFNYVADSQHFYTWNKDVSNVMDLINSATAIGASVIIFHNCFENTPDINNVCFIKHIPEITYEPATYRFKVYHYYLNKNIFNDNDIIFCVDSTDVTVLKYPDIIDNKIYVGYEYNSNYTTNGWIKGRECMMLGKNNNINDYYDIINNKKNHVILNAGIVGGYTSTLKLFLTKMNDIIDNYDSLNYISGIDMLYLNYTIFKYFNDSYFYGDIVNTKFNKYETNNKIAWFKHK